MKVLVTHLWPNGNNPLDGIFLKGRPHDRVVHIPFGGKITANPFKLVGFYWRAIRAIWAVRKEDIECHWWLPLGIVCAMFSKPVVWCHGTDVKLLRDHYWLRFLTGFWALRVRRWYCVSDYLKKELFYALGVNAFIEPMPIGPEFKDYGLKRSNSVLFIGPRNDRNKRFDLAERWAKENNMPIHSIYGVPHECMPDVYNRHSHCISTSDFEGYGLAIREAKACGCKTVGFVGDGRTEDVMDIVLNKDVTA